jgi:hypothetical protein
VAIPPFHCLRALRGIWCQLAALFLLFASFATACAANIQYMIESHQQISPLCWGGVVIHQPHEWQNCWYKSPYQEVEIKLESPVQLALWSEQSRDAYWLHSPLSPHSV